MSVRAHQGLLQPTAVQSRRLDELLESQRMLYNAALEERRGVWRWESRSVSRYKQYQSLTGWDDPVLGFGVCPARGTLLRLDRAFKAFYRRAHAGEKPGFPRFKAKARFDSVEYPEGSCWRIEGNRLDLKGVGSIRFRTSKRGIRGVPKTLTVRREGRRWRFTVFCTEVPEERLEPTGQSVGIDVGVSELAATSDGELIANPRWVARSAERLADAQRVVAGRKRGSARRRKAAAELARSTARQPVSAGICTTSYHAASSTATTSSSTRTSRSPT